LRDLLSNKTLSISEDKNGVIIQNLEKIKIK